MIDLDLSKVEFSKWDKFFNVKIPTQLYIKLAYETGLHIGDGHLTMIRRKDNNARMFQIVFSGNWKEEKDFYFSTISTLIRKLYNKIPYIRKESKNSIRLYFYSQAIATFKNRVLELPAGKKIGKIRIPKIIRESPLEIRKNCLKGIVDTDFSLSFKKNCKYPVISADFPLECKMLVNDIEEVLIEANIKPSICIENRKDERYIPTKYYKGYKIDINGKNNLENYIKNIGFLNPVHITKYLVWKRTGICNPYTTINDRTKLLASVAQSGRVFAWYLYQKAKGRGFKSHPRLIFFFLVS